MLITRTETKIIHEKLQDAIPKIPSKKKPSNLFRINTYYLSTINVNIMVKFSGYEGKIDKIRENFEIKGVETKFIHLKHMKIFI